MRRKIYLIVAYLLFYILVNSKFLQAQTVSAPMIDTPLTSSKTYFYNGDIVVPYSNGEVSVTNGAKVEILSTTEVTLLPGFLASVDSLCGEFVGGIRTCPELFVEKQLTHISCYGKSDGKVRLLCTGGIEPYSFLWSPLNQITQSITGLSAGNYSFVVSDNSGCSFTDSIVILEPIQLSANATSTTSLCHDNTGTVSISPLGGAGNYKYFWEADGYNQSTRDGLAAGIYDILVSDSNNCSIGTQALISDSNGPEVNVTILKGVSCHGYNDASAMITTPFTLGQTPIYPCGGSPDRLSAGNYPIIQSDSSGCITVININIVEPEPLIIDVEKIMPVCGSNNGRLIANVSGGTAPYSYNWDNHVFDSINDGLYSGVHYLSVVDFNGCNISTTSFLNDLSAFELSITKEDVKCNKSADGTITVNPIGGTPPFAYHWFDEFQEIGNNFNKIENLPAGLFKVIVIDESNCKSVDSIRINYPSALELDVEIHNPTTDISFDGSVLTYLSGGVPPFGYEWSNGSISNTLRDLGIGLWSYKIYDSNNCEIEGSLRLAASPSLSSSAACNHSGQPFDYSTLVLSCGSSCNPQAGQLALNIVTDFGAIPDDNISDQMSFEWASDFINQNYCSQPVKLIIPPGTYDVGRQDLMPNTYGLSFNVFQLCNCANVTIEGLINPITGEKPKLRFESCLKYGSFWPLTGERYLVDETNPIGNSTSDRMYAAELGYIIFLERCKNINLLNLDLDGNIENLSIGGYYSLDLAGINLPNGGARIENCSNIFISNCDMHHFGQDGLMVRPYIGSAEVRPVNETLRIVHSKFNHNSRQGFHWNGGNAVFASKCEFNYNGYGPWGGTKNRGGLGMELDGSNFGDLANGRFVNCNFNFNNAAGVQCNSQPTSNDHKVYDFLFKKCTFLSGESSYSTFINSRNVKFECSLFCGQVQSAYDASNSDPLENFNTKFISCDFLEEYYDPQSGSMRSFTKSSGDCVTGLIAQPPYLINIPNRKGRVLIDNSTIETGTYNHWLHFSGGIGLTNMSRLSNNIFIKKNGELRNNLNGANSELAILENSDVTTNNKVFTPTNHPQCRCQPIPSEAYPLNCWWANNCSANGVVGYLRLPRANGGVYCDAGAPHGDPNYCNTWLWPDGYTDAGYNDTPPCGSPKYENPPFTIPTIGIFPAGSTITLPPTGSCPLVPVPPARLAKKNPDETPFEVFPIPANDKIHITGGQIGNIIYIYDIIGKLVQTKLIESEDYVINIEQFDEGIYYVKSSGVGSSLKFMKLSKKH